ncbi:FmdB family transcriptional regulator [Capsulimonas corticalis]|uniref:FmdB family transcriptional regulator n=1 Tax=Capsulimonas corticalis TaxID=2219043 RepID=A0A402D040_9BACT|nr:FmdB family zinc ribbon protein [Capsulimonas corticalis]BDI33790.1 FmdB family transcriptional regulator [Capsulimonas corticalis]
MPTYGYECTGCADQFEIMQSIKDDALTTCEKCGGKLRKRVYPVGIAFKGSGFYVNDYKGAAPATGGGSSGSASEPAKSETPPAAPSTESAPKSEPAKAEPAKTTP